MNRKDRERRKRRRMNNRIDPRMNGQQNTQEQYVAPSVVPMKVSGCGQVTGHGTVCQEGYLCAACAQLADSYAMPTPEQRAQACMAEWKDSCDRWACDIGTRRVEVNDVMGAREVFAIPR